MGVLSPSASSANPLPILGLLALACLATRAHGQCSGVEIVPRSGWTARPPKSVTRMRNPAASYVIIHHTTGSGCGSKAGCSGIIRGHQNHHMDQNGWSDIGYNFLIGGDGRVYEGRGWGVVGAHTRGYNGNGVAFAFVGDFSKTAPNAKMLDAAQKLTACGIAKGKISRDYSLHGHRDVNCTACPGNALYNIIKTWPKFKGRLKKSTC